MLTRLRIAGFKSFAEPVILDILPGLTGIVGPNGCGKSNVVEALRWAMGETSARSLRGGEMDDVIFAGTTARASRNLAEVTVTLKGGLPAPYEAEAELQVTRRIERGAGSTFRVNGREQRARDVQTLYADLASGARSSGMVSQGRVSQLVNARPEERRQVLEEAAGITGLHARRHEAELKLRAAEQNLSRAEDLRTQIEGARESLRRQARQTARYRNISGLVRAAEAEHLAVLLARSRNALAEAMRTHEAATAAAQISFAEMDSARAELDSAETALPALRAELSTAERALERSRMAADGLAGEAQRLRQEADAAAARLVEAQADLDEAQAAEADSHASVGRLASEVEALASEITWLPAEIEASQGVLRLAEEAQTEARAEAEAARGAAEAARVAGTEARAAVQAAGARVAAARARLAAEAAELAGAETARVPAARVEAAQARVAACAAALAAARADEAAATRARLEAAGSAAACRAEDERAGLTRAQADRGLQEAQARHGRLSASFASGEADHRALLAARPPAAVLEAAQADAEAAVREAADAEIRLERCETAARHARAAQEEAQRQARDAAAARTRLAIAHSDAGARLDRCAAELARAAEALETAERAGPSAEDFSASRLRAAAADRQAEAALAVQDVAFAKRAGADAAISAARLACGASRAEMARLSGEAAGLADAIGPEAGAADLPYGISVPAGLELAIGAALGENGSCLDQDAVRFWRNLPLCEPPAPLPDGGRRLDTLVKAPAALARLFGSAVLLDEGVDGDAVQAVLPVGATAIRRDGASWRWDGRVVRADAPNPAAIRLLQRRRLAELRAALGTAQARLGGDEDAVAAREADLQAAIADEQAAKAGLMEAELLARAAQAAADRIATAQAQMEAMRATLAPEISRLHRDLDDAETTWRAAEIELSAAADPALTEAAACEAERTAGEATEALETARSWRLAARQHEAEAQAAVAWLQTQEADVAARLRGTAPALEELRQQVTEAATRLADAELEVARLPDPALLADRLRDALAAELSAQAAELEAEAARARDEAALDAARGEAAATDADHARAESQAASLAGMLARSTLEMESAEAGRDGLALAAAKLPDEAELDAAAANARLAQESAAARLAAARGEHGSLVARLPQAEAAWSAMSGDLAAWRMRYEAASSRAVAVALRCKAARVAWEGTGATPDALTARAGAAAAALASAELDHADAQARSEAAEARARSFAGALRAAEQRQSDNRETRARAEATQEAAAAAERSVLALVAERLGGETIPEAADDSEAAEERARRKFERLGRERDEMGPVNLRAELELEELDARAAALEREREELATAIAKLRGAIGHINREGRERLTSVFTQVDQHFRTLFTRMMGGGRAHLAWAGSDDPLTAGLEIYAEPPGKKLSSLALLSGGEQALTALSLIFAVFRCTPAPISVLDEVDAPLDDANVERFCTLLEDVVRDTGTRFLVVTHHQLTMSRMDRLFGVTMQERGVSRVLSVDLGRAVRMVAPVLQAAE